MSSLLYVEEEGDSEKERGRGGIEVKKKLQTKLLPRREDGGDINCPRLPELGPERTEPRRGCRPEGEWPLPGSWRGRS